MSEKNENVKIQVASVEDAEELLAIYAPYVEKTAITFEYEVPSVEEFKGRIAHVLQRFPYLKAVEDGKILGYAYVSPFKERAAYGWSVETSIYVDENVKHKGVGRKLHEVLEAVLKEQGILNNCIYTQGGIYETNELSFMGPVFYGNCKAFRHAQ